MRGGCAVYKVHSKYICIKDEDTYCRACRKGRPITLWNLIIVFAGNIVACLNLHFSYVRYKLFLQVSVCMMYVCMI